MTFVPLCMTPDELAAWHEANEQITWANNRAKRPCSDCPRWFAEKMRAENRCNGDPRQGRTGRHATMTVERRRQQWRDAAKRRRMGIRVKRTPEEVADLRERIVNLYEQGLPTGQVAQAVGVSPQHARLVRNSFGKAA